MVSPELPALGGHLKVSRSQLQEAVEVNLDLTESRS